MSGIQLVPDAIFNVAIRLGRTHVLTVAPTRVHVLIETRPNTQVRHVTVPTDIRLVVDVNQGLIHMGPTISLHVIEIDDTQFPEGTFVALIPVARLELPVRIGRRDLTRNPPISPEFAFDDLLNAMQPGVRPVVSRLHAALQLDGNRPAIKALVDYQNTTWVRHSGDDRISPIPPNTVRPLEHRDVIVLGSPKSRHVTLRVVFSHS